MEANFWKDKKVFLTGHTGFKGSWMTSWLLKLGAKVYGYSLAPDTQPSHYELLGLSDKIEETIGDIRDYSTLNEVMIHFNPDIVFHLAAQPLVRLSYDEPLETFETNVMGTANLMNACRNAKSLGAVVVITTDKCYKNNEWEWPYRETDELGGYDPYSNSKACSELVVDCYRNSFFNPKLSGDAPRVGSARAGNVVGGGDWALDRLIPDMMRSIDEGRVMKVRSPSAVRPWQHVLEPLNGYLMLAQRLYNKETEGKGFNFGPDYSDTVTVLDILKKVKEIMPNKFNYEVEEDLNSPHEAGMLKLDSSRATTELGWAPKMKIEDTIRLVVEWYAHHNENPKDVESFTANQLNWYESL